MKSLIETQIVLTVTFLSLLSPAYGQWEHHFIDPDISYTAVSDIDDFDGDGDMDVVVAEYGVGNVVLYENNKLTWKKYIIDAGLGGAHCVDMADFDGDGNTDMLAAGLTANLVVWYKNDGGDPTNWTKDTVDHTHGTGLVAYAEDINGDGATDVVASSWSPGKVVWYENNLSAGWTYHIIGTNVTGSEDMDIGDIDNDGKPDVVLAATGLDKVILFKNNLPVTDWTEIIIAENLDEVFMPRIADIDNDGDMDVAASGMNAAEGEADVAWYENDGSGQTWTEHSFSSDMIRSRCLYVVDTDNDDYQDVAVTDGSGEVILFRNEDGGQNWTEYIIDDNLYQANAIYPSDIDGDNDFDFVVTNRSASLVWYENYPLGTAYGESVEVSSSFIQPQNGTLEVYALINNPEDHSAAVFSTIQGDQSGFTDSLPLFDDGMHNDNDPLDNHWANTFSTSVLQEDYYEAVLSTYDSVLGSTFTTHTPARFTTIGPVKYDKYEFTSADEVPQPGDRMKMYLSLKNEGTTASATNIKGELSSTDPRIELYNTNQSYEVIPAGESKLSERISTIVISEDYPVGEEITFEIGISSNGYPYWFDTFSITVEAPDHVNDISKPNFRIYPNPIQDQLSIEFDNTVNPGTSIILYDITGKVVYSKNLDQSVSSTYTIDLSSFGEGIYFIHISNDQYSFTEKVIKVE